MKRKGRIKLVSLLCECGCGEHASEGKRFIWGHNGRMKKKRKSVSLLCECGCEEFANEGSRFLRGHHNKTSEARKRLSENNKGILHPMYGKSPTEETKKRMSENNKYTMYGKKGKLHPAYGTKRTEEIKRKMSESKKGEKNPMYGKESTEEQRRKMSKRMKGERNPFYGKHHTKEIRKRISKVLKGNLPWIKGKKHTKETRKRMRISAIERISNFMFNGGQVHPGYNSDSCKFFEQFDRDFNTQGQYATNKEEHYIKALGYWVDYINFDLKLIIEWDEESHYDVDENLKEKDVQRQKEIQEYFPDFLFLRIKEMGFQKDSFYEDLRDLKKRKLFIEGS